MIIDANNLIVGRIATVVAKRALLGEQVDVVNCANSIFTGRREMVLSRFKRFRDMGNHTKGPFIHRNPAKIVKRVIRGMLPHRQPKGREAFKRIKCYSFVPENMKDQKMETIEVADKKKLSTKHYISVGEISKLLGGKSG